MNHDPLDDLEPQSDEEWSYVKELRRVREKTGWEAKVEVSADGSANVSFATSLRATPADAPKEIGRRPSAETEATTPTEPSFLSDILGLEQDSTLEPVLLSTALEQLERERTRSILDSLASPRELEAALWFGGVSAAADLDRLTRSLAARVAAGSPPTPA